MSGLFDCVAGDTRVLTDSGWKTIVTVTLSDRVWDGFNWVRHDGVIHKGVRHTISLGGVGITPNHEVLVGEDWVNASDVELDAAQAPSGHALETNNVGGEQAVYDILNAGPEHRFTIAVSRCFQMVISNCDCACAAAPDYAPFANASKESAELMAKLGQDQLAETKRQYDLNRAVSDPVVKAQTDLMAQSIEQGNDYIKFMKEYGRPVDIALQQEAMASGGQTAQDAAAGRVRGGIEKQQAAEQAQQDRAMAGMGVNPNSGRFAGLTSARSIANAAATAGAMDNARESEKNLGFAKKLDVSGVFRGLPGVSQGAYSMANQSGNSAVGNQMAPSGQMLAGQATAAGMIGQGQQQYVSGLGSIMGAQQQLNISNAQMSNQGGGAAAGIGDLAMGAAALGWKPFSDPRLKEHVVKVGESDRGFGIYEFSFKGDDTRWRGVMADEIEKLIPEAIQVDMDGYRHVNYTMLGIEMQRVNR